ncbi:MAG: type II toxin-antitoxin system VapC family toxin [Acidimicrobiia bacterium]|nr:type II toxin-antitoxin system VapC family toxin [Acidimicrobiia bacterium]
MTADTKVVPDSWSVVEAANGSRFAASEIQTLISEQIPVMSAMNCGEVYSAVVAVQGVVEARNIIGLLRQIVVLNLPDYPRIMQTAHLKSTYYMALGDSFAVATALHHNAELWTGDPELLFGDAPWRTRDLRESRSTTNKQRTGKIGRRARAKTRPPHEPEISLTNLMRFLNGSLDIDERHQM